MQHNVQRMARDRDICYTDILLLRTITIWMGTKEGIPAGNRDSQIEWFNLKGVICMEVAHFIYFFYEHLLPRGTNKEL